GLLLSWDSVDELFPEGMVDDMLTTYLEHLRRLAHVDWEQPVTPELPPGQRAIRAEVNATAGPLPEHVPGGGLLHTPMFDIAAADPDRVAVIDGERTVSFGELADHALRIAALLIQHGVNPGDVVGVSTARGAAQVAALYGVLAAGAAYVPVARDQPPQRRRTILERAGVAVVLTDDPAQDAATGHDLDGLSAVVVGVGDAWGCSPGRVYR
ncbi:AMP-binding protein, partial [Nocardia asiatica]